MCNIHVHASPGTIGTLFSECISEFHLAVSSDENFRSVCSIQQSFLRSSLLACKEHACSSRAKAFQYLSEVCELLACNSTETESLRLQGVNNGWDIYTLDYKEDTAEQTWVFPTWAVILTAVLGSVCLSILVGTVTVCICRRKGRKEKTIRRSEAESNRDQQPNVENDVESNTQTVPNQASNTIRPQDMDTPDQSATGTVGTNTTLFGSESPTNRGTSDAQTNAHGSGNETNPRSSGPSAGPPSNRQMSRNAANHPSVASYMHMASGGVPSSTAVSRHAGNRQQFNSGDTAGRGVPGAETNAQRSDDDNNPQSSLAASNTQGGLASTNRQQLDFAVLTDPQRSETETNAHGSGKTRVDIHSSGSGQYVVVYENDRLVRVPLRPLKKINREV